MKAEEIAKAIYIKCFDDDFKFPEVLNALRICAEENAETIKQLQQENKTLQTLLKAEREVNEKKEYLKYTEHLQNENEQLKAQIEKMKCCNNCEHYTWNMSNAKCQFRYESRKACDNWKMKE